MFLFSELSFSNSIRMQDMFNHNKMKDYIYIYIIYIYIYHYYGIFDEIVPITCLEFDKTSKIFSIYCIPHHMNFIANTFTIARASPASHQKLYLRVYFID